MISVRRLSTVSKIFNRREIYRQRIFLPVLNVCPMCSVAEKSQEPAKKLTIAQRLKKAIIDDVPPPPPIETQSLVKGLLINRIDNSMLVFPEFGTTSSVVDLNLLGVQLEKYFNENVNSKEIDIMRKIPDKVVDDLKKMGMYGLQVSTELGGLGFNNKEMLRVYEELSKDWSIYTSVSYHNDIIIKSIQLFGTEEQKKKYLPGLASGSLTGAFCLHEEESGQDIASVKTTACYVYGSNKIELNGKKTWITNGADADILIVFAKLKHESFETATPPTTAFIINRKVGSTNIINSDRKNTIGIKGIVVSDLEFVKVELEENDILGAEGQGFKVALSTIGAQRFAFAAAAASFLRRLLGVLTQHCNVTKRWGMILNDSPLVKARIGEISLNTYKIESLAYYIGGMLDDYPNKDFAIEGAIAMRESRQVLNESLLIAIEMFGASARTSDVEFERLLRDFTTLSAFMSTNDYLTGFIAMDGIKAYANEWKTILHKGNNPLKFPWESATEKYMRRDLYRDSFKIRHYIHEKVHPSLESGCRLVEETIAKFEYVFRGLIYRYGKTLEDEHLALERITNLLTNLLSMIATITRASRSYSIGLKNGDQEILMCVTLCQTLRLKCLHIMNELLSMQGGDVEDLSVKKVGEDILKHNGYTLDQPIARNCFLLFDIMVNVGKGVLVTCDPAMKQFLLHLDETLQLGFRFVIKDLDETHLFISQESVATLQQKIDTLMESLSPDFVEK